MDAKQIEEYIKNTEEYIRNTEEYIKNAVEKQAKEQFIKLFPELLNENNKEDYFKFFLSGYQHAVVENMNVLDEIEHDSEIYLEKMFGLKIEEEKLKWKN